MKLVVLSDLHLMPPDAADRDLGNGARLEMAIDRINTGYADADLVVLGGDLVDRGHHSDNYRDLKTALTRLVPPVAMTIGNHDHRENFTEIFGAAHLNADGFVQSAHVIDGHHVIVIDSLEINTDPEWPYYSARTGYVCERRRAWLADRLQDAKGALVIAILHHHMVPVGIQMDAASLRDTGLVLDLFEAHGDVRQVISGHIHMTTTTMHRGIPFTTIAGGHSTSVEDFGTRENKYRRKVPAQMAIILSDTEKTTVHFENYLDAHEGF